MKLGSGIYHNYRSGSQTREAVLNDYLSVLLGHPSRILDSDLVTKSCDGLMSNSPGRNTFHQRKNISKSLNYNCFY